MAMEVLRMKYKQYKEHYSDCETVYGSYDKATKTIEVEIPEGRMKTSGVRGKSYGYYHFNGVEHGTNRNVQITIKAVSVGNAIKKLPSRCTWDLK